MFKKSQLHRDFVVFSGTQTWGAAVARKMVAEDAILLGGSQCSTQQVSSPWLTAQQGRKLLGSTVSGVVMDAHSGFDPDLFALVAGSINGGGLLALLVPELDDWPQQEHFPPAQRFLKRFIRKLRSDAAVVLVEEEANRFPLESERTTTSDHQRTAISHPGCATLDQQHAVEKILRVVNGHRRRPLVLTSDRGRGKSSALGVAAADLLRQGKQRIVVTAPRLAATTALFERLVQQFPNAQHCQGRCQTDSAVVIFEPPDRLLLAQAPADLLIVDEAAAISASILLKLLKRYSRIVFATTVHGYEGSGRGFAVRFSKILDRETPAWHQLEMLTPIRWAADDPLEAFVFDALLLKADAAQGSQFSDVEVATCNFEKLNRDSLAADEARLTELFGLLVLAHYQTCASDLRQLLDDPAVTVYAAISANNHIVATALVVDEDGLDSALEDQVRQGRRRLKGNLSTQSLVAHLGLSDVCAMSCRRILRVAVHPDVQRRGLATALLKTISSAARDAGVDYLATSFGVTTELLHFWRDANYFVVKIGTRCNAASAAYSGLMMLPLTAAGERLSQQARDRFDLMLPLLLQEDLAALEPQICIALAQSSPDIRLNSSQYEALNEFAQTDRSFISVLPELTRLAHQVLRRGNEVCPHQGLLVMKLLQKRSLTEIAVQQQLTGKSQVLIQLRDAVRCILLPDGQGKNL